MATIHRSGTNGGGGTLAFKHLADKETTVLSRKTALLVPAVKSSGQDRVDNSVMETLRAKLHSKEQARAV